MHVVIAISNLTRAAIHPWVLNLKIACQYSHMAVMFVVNRFVRYQMFLYRSFQQSSEGWPAVSVSAGLPLGSERTHLPQLLQSNTVAYGVRTTGQSPTAASFPCGAYNNAIVGSVSALRIAAYWSQNCMSSLAIHVQSNHVKPRFCKPLSH